MDEIWDEDHLIVLDKGKIIEDGTVKEILAKNGASSVSDAFESIIVQEEERLR